MKTRLKDGQKLPAQFRTARIFIRSGSTRQEDGKEIAAELDLENRTVKGVSVSSDEPYERYYGTEILSHAPGAVDLERVTSGASPLLYNHDRDALIGKVSNPVLKNGKLYVDLKFSQSEAGQQMLRDLQDDILTECSIGYEVNRFEVDEDEQTYTATRWTLYECSLVSIPADFTVGVGRASGNDGSIIEIRKTEKDSQIILDAKAKESQKRETNKAMDETPEQKKTREDNEAKERAQSIKDGIRVAREREGEIRAIALKANKSLPKEELQRALDACADDEKAVEAFRKLVFEKYYGNAEPVNTPGGEGNGDIRVVSEPHKLSMGRRFVDSDSFKSAMGRRGQGERTASMDVGYPVLGIRGKVEMAKRAGFTSSDLSAVNVQIQTGVIGLGMQRLTIMDLIAPGSTGAAAIIYPRENSFGTVDGVAVAAGAMPRGKSVGERGIKPLWEPDLTTETANVRKIAITTKVPDEFMADFPAAQSFIDERLPFMVDTETEFQILYGDGLGNNLKGIFNTLGVQTRAITTTDDSTIAMSLMKGLTDIRVNSFFEPDAYAFHPYDWETAKLLRDANRNFLAGGPYYITYTNGVFVELNTFWGKPCVVSTAVTYGKPLAGCWKLGAQYFLREGMRIEMTNANEDDFRRNLIMLRAEHRLALATYRPISFLEFTGMPARV